MSSLITRCIEMALLASMADKSAGAPTVEFRKFTGLSGLVRHRYSNQSKDWDYERVDV